jgi:hypothetical protein
MAQLPQVATQMRVFSSALGALHDLCRDQQRSAIQSLRERGHLGRPLEIPIEPVSNAMLVKHDGGIGFIQIAELHGENGKQARFPTLDLLVWLANDIAAYNVTISAYGEIKDPGTQFIVLHHLQNAALSAAYLSVYSSFCADFWERYPAKPLPEPAPRYIQQLSDILQSDRDLLVDTQSASKKIDCFTFYPFPYLLLGHIESNSQNFNGIWMTMDQVAATHKHFAAVQAAAASEQR